MNTTRRLEPHETFSPADKAASDYRLIPFDVPAGVQRLRVEYSYASLGTGQAVIDIGAFDPRGSGFLAGHGFRGWSGSFRRSFEISPVDATPGYLPGPIFPGEWNILLGLYKIPADGCRCDLAIVLSLELVTAQAPHAERPKLDRPTDTRWYAGDLHNHTYHSDAPGSLDDLVVTARTWGLDFIAVTEHNTTSHMPLLTRYQADDLLLIPGQEITTYYGHANTWGSEKWYDFRCKGESDMARVRQAVQAAGALFSVNHPRCPGSPWEYDGVDQADCIEVWQLPWLPHDAMALAIWDRELAQGHRLVGVGGSDNHQGLESDARMGRHMGLPTTWVYAEGLSMPAILAGIRAGHVMITNGSASPMVYLEADADGDGAYEAMMGDEIRVAPGATIRWRCRVEGGESYHLRLVSSNGETLVPVSSSAFVHAWDEKAAQDGYLRAELLQFDEVESDLAMMPHVALTNPIYVRVA